VQGYLFGADDRATRWPAFSVMRLALGCCLVLLAAAGSHAQCALAESEILAPAGGLPDQRAYELITPPETNGALFTIRNEAEGVFETPEVSPDGESVTFNTGGLLSGMEGNGVIDAYQAIRTGDGWEVRTVEPTGAQSPS
jgi:hypothetical protein